MARLQRIGWENGTLVTPAKVTVNGVIYEVTPEQYTGSTPVSAENLKEMEDNTEDAINNLGETATTLLNWTGIGSTSSTSYSLDDDLTKYKYLYIMMSTTNSDTSGQVNFDKLINSSLFKTLYGSGKSLCLHYDGGDTNYNAQIKYASDTSINAWKSSQISTLYVKIIGLN